VLHRLIKMTFNGLLDNITAHSNLAYLKGIAMNNSETVNDLTRQNRFWRNTAITLGIIIATAIICWLVFRYILFPTHFNPVELSQKEAQVLQSKLDSLGIQTSVVDKPNDTEALTPEAYTEKNAQRDISFNEKEINALLAKNTDLADKLAIDLSDELISAKFLIPLDEDFPIMGGKTLKINAGLELAFENGRPKVVLKGVSSMGVPIPNAWLGNLKNVDVIKEFGGSDGFWKSVADGIELINVDDGKLHIKLKE